MLRLAGGIVQGWYARAVHETEPALIKDWKAAFNNVPPFWRSPGEESRGGHDRIKE